MSRAARSPVCAAATLRQSASTLPAALELLRRARRLQHLHTHKSTPSRRQSLEKGQRTRSRAAARRIHCPARERTSCAAEPVCPLPSCCRPPRSASAGTERAAGGAKIRQAGSAASTACLACRCAHLPPCLRNSRDQVQRFLASEHFGQRRAVLGDYDAAVDEPLLVRCNARRV